MPLVLPRINDKSKHQVLAVDGGFALYFVLICLKGLFRDWHRVSEDS